jgi:hypothetical protein
MAYSDMSPPEAGANASKRTRILSRKSALWSERSSWDTHWMELSQYQQPRLGRFVKTDRNNGMKRHQNILDNTAIFAHRTLAAGMMSGMTSPARPWFRLTLSDKDLMEFESVKLWLHKVTQLLQAVFSASNTYRAFHSCYEELGLFGTWASIVLPNFNNVLHHYPLTTGEYALATDNEGNVNTLVHEYQMTVEQLVMQFGKENVSRTVANLYDTHRYDAWVDVIHLIEPRRDRDTTKRDAKNMPFKSCYIEPGSESYDDKYLRESGFQSFPVLAPRWVVTGNDVYGHSPGMECQGDVRQLQHQQLRKGQAIDYMTNPPIQVPTAYKDQARNRLPGGVMFVDATGPGGGVRSAYEVQLNLSHLGEDIRDVRDRIRSAYYADLFLMLANDTRSGVTATEVAERHEEKLLMLGPVLERLDNELLTPKIDMAFEYCRAAGILPPAPPEVQGMELKVELVSVLAQAQRMVAASGIDRLLGTVGNIAQFKPEVLDKLDFDQVVDDYSDMFGVNPALIITDDKVAEIRAQRAQAEQIAQRAATAQPLADAAKTVSDIDVNNVKDIMKGLQGYGTPPQ